MRVIDPDNITNAVAELYIKSNLCLGADIKSALAAAHQAEEVPLARYALNALIENAKTAEREGMPVCQDTGMAVVFVSAGSEIFVKGDIEAAINEGVRRGCREGNCRASVVKDPVRRTNTGDNTPAVIHYEIVPGDSLKITVAPKGFGSENMSGLKMLNPSDGIDGIEGFVTEVVKKAGANPCPPVIVGVGIGGTMEKAALLSKQALLREAGSAHPESFWAETEARLLTRINALGIGAAGFGGKTTALAVHIKTYATHIAGLPVAVNIGCHATRHKTVAL